MIDDAKLHDFMQEFVLSDAQLQTVYERFDAQISKGLGQESHPESDIKCFVTYVHDLPTGQEVGKYLALDLGGTNFRVLLVQFHGDKHAVVLSRTYPVSKAIKEGPGTQLFDHIATCLAEFVAEHKVAHEHLPLGFTFSFPCVQLGLTKALLVRWTKDFKCAGVEQQDVCELLQQAIERQHKLRIDVMAILNDTTGTLMSCAHRNAECRIGVIVGTGCNACYVERSENVGKLEDQRVLDREHVLINTEWGAFGDSGCLEFMRTDYDRVIDSLTVNKQTQLFEKLISGMYLGELVRLVLKRAIDLNLIFAQIANKSSLSTLLAQNRNCFQTAFVSQIETDEFPEFNNTRRVLRELFNLERASLEDCQRLQYICQCIGKRAASLVAVGVATLLNRINEPHVVVGVDGSVYRYHPKFDAYMRETLQKLVKPKLTYDLMLSEDGSGRGAALVAAVASQNA